MAHIHHAYATPSLSHLRRTSSARQLANLILSAVGRNRGKVCIRGVRGILQKVCGLPFPSRPVSCPTLPCPTLVPIQAFWQGSDQPRSPPSTRQYGRDGYKVAFQFWGAAGIQGRSRRPPVLHALIHIRFQPLIIVNQGRADLHITHVGLS